MLLGVVAIAVVAFWLFALSRLPREQRWAGKDPGDGPNF